MKNPTSYYIEHLSIIGKTLVSPARRRLGADLIDHLREQDDIINELQRSLGYWREDAKHWREAWEWIASASQTSYRDWPLPLRSPSASASIWSSDLTPPRSAQNQAIASGLVRLLDLHSNAS